MPAEPGVDCTTYLDPAPTGSAEPYVAVPGRKTATMPFLAVFGGKSERECL
jgi:hypothetical protein